jgi:hypothetical protein
MNEQASTATRDTNSAKPAATANIRLFVEDTTYRGGSILVGDLTYLTKIEHGILA